MKDIKEALKKLRDESEEEGRHLTAGIINDAIVRIRELEDELSKVQVMLKEKE